MGGAYLDTKKPKNNDLDSHHCPATDCYKNSLVSDEFESTIKMAPEDHRLTASYGRSREAQAYSDKPKEL